MTTIGSNQENVIEPVFRGAQLLASTLLEHAGKHPQTSKTIMEDDVGTGIVLETAKVQAVEVIGGLKSVQTEASGIPEEVFSKAIEKENLATSEALNTGMTSINLNCILEDDFYYSTLNHKSHTPSLNPSPNQSPKRTSLPIGESPYIRN